MGNTIGVIVRAHGSVTRSGFVPMFTPDVVSGYVKMSACLLALGIILNCPQDLDTQVSSSTMSTVNGQSIVAR
jgi:hypothetical protein